MAQQPWGGKNKVAIVGVAHSQIGRKLERPLGALAMDACLAAIADAGLTLKDIDGLAGAGDGPEPGLRSAPLSWMVEGLGIERLDWWGTGADVSNAIGYAINALANNLCKYVVAWRALAQPRGIGFGSGTRNAAVDAPRRAPLATLDDQFAAPYGLGDGETTRYAPAYMRYMKMYGAKREHLATYAVTARANANKNPHAIFYDQSLTYEDYMSCRMISDPLCLFDCDLPVDGAAAIVLTRADLAKDLKQPPAYVTAYGTGGWDWRTRPPELNRFTSAGNVARTMWASTDLKPSDLSGANFYDGFASNIYWWVEAMGFCKEGEGFEYIQDGRIAITGEMPLNTFGGQLSEGRLLGMGHWVEAAKQVQGRADDKPGDRARQVPNVENFLVCSALGPRPTGVILSPEPR